MKNYSILAILILFSIFLNTHQVTTEVDVNTWSNYLEVEIKNFDLDFTVDFDSKAFTGKIALYMFPLIENLKEVILDGWNLDIKSISFGSLAHDIEIFEFDSWVQHFCQDNCYQGSSIVIDVSKLWTEEASIPQHAVFQLYITYGKSDLNERQGYSFVEPKHTKGGKYPMFYTQNEPIYMRTWIPFQDTPMTSTSWSAKITAPSELQVFMSGIEQSVTPNQDGTSTTYFKSENHMTPGFYMGLVIGDFQTVKMAEKIYLVAEKENIEDGEILMRHVEQMIAYTEEYMGKSYFWSSFTVIIMPDNYPLQGAAHPGLTFVSPTLLTESDYGRDDILHLIANSYFGNEITHANWSNYWIAQGFATFLRRKVQPNIFGNSYPDMDRMDGNYTMFMEMRDMNNGIEDSFASLHPDTKGISPDDALSIVPFEKGYQFLVYIENIVGANEMQKILRAFLTEQELKGIDYEHFKQFLEDYTEEKLPSLIEKIQEIDWDLWIFEAGLAPKNLLPEFTSEEFDVVYSLANKFLQFQGTSLPKNYDQIESWHQVQKYAFVDTLIVNIYQLDRRVIYQLDNIYDFKNDNDLELQQRWFELTAIMRYTYNDNELFLREFVSMTGRTKYLIPVYQSLITSNQNSLAQQLLEENKDWYHPYTYYMLNEIVNGNSVKVKQRQRRDDL